MAPDLYLMNASSNCRSILLTAAALKIKLNTKEVNMLTGDHLKPEYLKINPQHTIPTLVDDGFVLVESRSIARYLINKYGGDDNPLYPKDPKARALVDARLDFDLGTLLPQFGTYFYPLFTDGKFDESKFDKVQEALATLNKYLEGQKYMAGSQLTIADFALVATVSNIEAIGVDLKPYPNITQWYGVVKATAPAYEEANGKGLAEFKGFVESKKAK